MSLRVDRLIEQFRALSEDEMSEFERALTEKRWTDDEWDRRMRSDAAVGKLDTLIAEADADIAAGRTKPLSDLL